MTSSSYIGNELGLFRRACNWKRYIKYLTRNYLGSRVLEVGAGIGSVTGALCDNKKSYWLCLEPDSRLAAILKTSIQDNQLFQCCEVMAGIVSNLRPDIFFDSVLYIDVLEHIKEDKVELRQASSLLKEGGYLIVLAPAHQWLFSRFDEEIGHFRRYSRDGLSSLVSENLECITLRYIDCMGIFISLINSVLLKRKLPTRLQLSIWDKLVLPISRALDPFFGYRVGKSLLGIWRKIK